MDYEDLVLEKKAGIATITLNAPDKMNALTAKMRESLPLAVQEVAKDDEVKVVIVTGAGRAFSAGGDVEWMKLVLDGTLNLSRYERFQVAGLGWGNIFPWLNKPVIAAVNGACVGAGLAIALSCDIRIVSEKAKFGSLFILRALVPDCGMSYFLPRAVGTGKALELMFTGELIDAVEAERLGITNRVVSPDELMKITQELASRIAQQPPIALELTKRLVYHSKLDDITRHFEWETYAQQLCFQTEDFKESVAAFLDKRPQPQFKGR